MSRYTDQTADYDIELIRGQSDSRLFQNWVQDGTPLILEDRDVRLDIKEKVNILRYPVQSLRPGNGLEVTGNSLTVNFSTENTESLQKDTYFYDIVLDDKVYIRGKIILSGRVTR